MRIFRGWLAAGLMLVSGAFAAPLLPPAQEVLRIAPALRGFGGSEANFESLAVGLQSGREVRLTSITPDGMREVVTFAAARAFPAAETALMLTGLQQALAAQGVASPTGWQIGIALLGGTLVTPEGSARMPAIIAPDPRKPMVVSMHTFAGSPANYRSLLNGLTRGRTITLATPGDRRAKVTFKAPGPPLSVEEAQQVLTRAAGRLTAQGIDDPTAEELRDALLSEQ